MAHGRRAAGWIGLSLATLLGCPPRGEPSLEKPPGPDGGAQAAAAPEAPADGSDPDAPRAGTEPAPEAEPAWKPRPEDRVTPHRPLEHPEALAAFYDALAVVDDDDAPRDVVRVVHLGASMIGADDLTAVLRGKFQTRFGDGGAGLVLLQRYMSNYLHRWVDLQARGWKNCYIAYLCKKDGHYGLGGAVFFSDGGAQTTISTRKHELGDEAAHFEVWYAAQPHGGRLDVRIDDGPWQDIDTRSETLEDRYHAIDVEQGPHTIEVKARGRVRGYGVVVETTGPGIVWDQFSMLGAFTKRMHGWDPEHIAGQVRHRDPDLIAFTYGGNDTRRVVNGKLDKDQYVAEYLEGVQRVRAGKPEASCLIIAISDRGRSLTYEVTGKHMEVIVEGQREVAEKAGCAFFDTYAAMGGAGSLRKWRAADPPLAAGDAKHLNHAGRVKLGGWIYDAIMAGYIDHRK